MTRETNIPMTLPKTLEYSMRKPHKIVADGTIVLVHGRGADQHDLLPLLPHLDPDQRLHAFSPQAPFPMPPGAAWYDVFKVGYPDKETFWQGFALLEHFLDHLPELTNIPLEKTVLVGFSQGAAMSLATGLAEGRSRPAGIAALSGFLPIVDEFVVDSVNAADLPIFVSHGTNDPVIDVSFGRESAQRLKDFGANVQYREDEIDHSISQSCIADLKQWLQLLL